MQVERLAAASYESYTAKAVGKDSLNTAGKDSATAAAAAAAKDTGQNTAERFKAIAEPIEKLLESVGVELKFHIHEDTGEVQAEVRDADGEKVIRKIPPDEQLDLAASIKELSTVFLNRTL